MRTLELALQQKGFSKIAGIDEAGGRGGLAGPVVAAAVIIGAREFRCEIFDSKRLSPKNACSLTKRYYRPVRWLWALPLWKRSTGSIFCKPPCWLWAGRLKICPFGLIFAWLTGPPPNPPRSAAFAKMHCAR